MNADIMYKKLGRSKVNNYNFDLMSILYYLVTLADRGGPGGMPPNFYQINNNLEVYLKRLRKIHKFLYNLFKIFSKIFKISKNFQYFCKILLYAFKILFSPISYIVYSIEIENLVFIYQLFILSTI